MKFGIYILSVITFFLLAGALPYSKGKPEVVFYTPAFIALLVLLSLSLIWCTWKKIRHWRNIPFVLSHFGAVVLLAGSAITYFNAKESIIFPMQVNKEYRVQQVPVNKKHEDLGFLFAVTKFNVEFYLPNYSLYKDSGKRDRWGRPDMKYVKKFSVTKDGLNVKGIRQYKLEDLKENLSGDWLKHIRLKNNNHLFLAPVEKQYLAKVEITPLNKDKTEGKPFIVDFSTNNPITYNGWRIYLMSYDKQTKTSVSVVAKKDPGQPYVIWGIWALVIGVAWLSWIRKPKQKKEMNHGAV